METRNRNEGYSSLGIYLREIGNEKLLSQEEEKALAIRIKAGDKSAVNTLIERNLRLVIFVAKCYEGLGLSLDELISEGNIGLINAAKRVDPDRDNKFSTFAYICIKNRIRRALCNNVRTIRLPVHKFAILRRIDGAVDSLIKRFERNPTDSEIAKEMQVSTESITRAKRDAAPYVYLNAPAYSDIDSISLSEIIEDENCVSPSKEADVRDMATLVRTIVSALPKRHIHIIILRFGLDGGEALKLVDVGKIIGITTERVRQIEYDALQRIVFGLEMAIKGEKVSSLNVIPRSFRLDYRKALSRLSHIFRLHD